MLERLHRKRCLEETKMWKYELWLEGWRNYQRIGPMKETKYVADNLLKARV